MMRGRVVIAGLMGMLLLALTVPATGQMNGTYTIDPAGTGSRNFSTWGAAVLALNAGVNGPVVFQVAPVTFREVVVVNPVNGASFQNTITFVAPGAPATLDGGGAPDTLFLQPTCLHLVFQNLVIRGATRYTLNLWGQNPGTPAYCHFRDLTVIGPTSAGLTAALMVSLASNCSFERCRFLGGQAVILSWCMTRNRFDRCEIDGLGTSVDLVRPLSFSYQCHDADNVWQNCFLHDCHPKSGRAFWFDSQTAGGFGNLFWHNTIVVNTALEAVRADGYGIWTACQSWRNNVIVNLGTGPCVAYGGSMATALVCNDFDHNCYHAPNAPLGAVALTDNTFRGSLAQWQALLAQNPQVIVPGGGTAYDPNSIEADPGLVRMTAPYDIHLRGNSPCIGAGTGTYVAGPWVTYNPAARVAMDFEGQDRPAGCAVDMGADESDTLSGSGTGRIGSVLALLLQDAPAAGLPYQIGSSLGTGPIPVDTRAIHLSADSLFWISTLGFWPHIFSGYRGVVDAQGQAQAAIRLPGYPALVGVLLRSAAVTLSASAPSGIRSISNTFSFTISR